MVLGLASDRDVVSPQFAGPGSGAPPIEMRPGGFGATGFLRRTGAGARDAKGEGVPDVAIWAGGVAGAGGAACTASTLDSNAESRSEIRLNSSFWASNSAIADLSNSIDCCL
jgi:hypothetical protein